MKRSVCLVVALLLVGGIVFASGSGEKQVTVGAKNFTEQYILGSMISILLRENGFQVEEKFGTGSGITREALVQGQTDMYPEYTGTAWAVYLGHEDAVNDPAVLYDSVKSEDLQENDIVWLERATLNNTYALAIKEDAVGEIGDSLSDLAQYVNENPDDLVFGVDHEFYERPDGFFAMAETYEMEANRNLVKTMDVGLTFEAIDKGQVDVAMVFATDGKLKRYNLRVLEDDQQFFPVYNIALTVRKEVLDQHPEIASLWASVAPYLDDETMQSLNYEVDAEDRPAEEVAREFLADKGLIESQG
jgi:osmoprotectant transport system substrate-binding protein